MKIKPITILFLLTVLISSGLSAQETKEIKLADIWKKRTFIPKSVEGLRPMNDGEHYCTLNEDDEIIEYSYNDGKKTRTIATLREMNKGLEEKELELDDYKFSDDESKILIATELEHIYRHSTKSYYYIWDIKKKKLTPLSEKGKQRLRQDRSAAKKIRPAARLHSPSRKTERQH